ncbi:methyltransferase domain-containing protein [Nonomuraea sp. KM90]|uniref:methyltransferase domain-containing protein n=1 Tax=Nonomuraea sp. KM90 TaxID=3457428 RepID=UPI003FCC66E9
MTTAPAAESTAGRMARLAEQLRELGATRTDAVHQAFATVPRHLFITGFYTGGDAYTRLGDPPGDDLLDQIYSDVALMTHRPSDAAGRPSSASMPRVVARMLEALQLRPGLRVLEIGAGTGYNAALIAAITGAHVVSVDISDVIVVEAAAALRRAGAVTAAAYVADGYLGHPERGPYDRIIATCGITGISPHWLHQLAPGGLILAPIAHAGFHPTLAVTVDDDGQPTGRGVLSSDFMAAGGPLYGWAADQAPPPGEVPADGDLTVWPDAAPALADDRYFDLWFALGAADTRITRAYTPGLDATLGMVCLHEPGRGTAWMQRDGAIRFTGSQDIAHQLTALIQPWDSADRPRITDWTVGFARSEAAEPLWHPTGWAR